MDKRAPGIVATDGAARPVVVGAVALAGALVYLPTLRAQLVYDDIHQVLDNPWISSLSNLPRVFVSDVWAFGEQQSNYYRPMMHIAYMLTYQFSGFDAWGYHLVNLLLHAAVSGLVFVLLWRLLVDARAADERGAIVPALIAALLFAVHPIHTEVVAWVACAPELLLTLFILLAFLAHRRAARGNLIVLAAAVLCFFGALLSKESAALIPAVFLLYDAKWGRGGSASAWRRRWIWYLAPLAAWLALRFHAIPTLAPQRHHPELTSWQIWINAFPLLLDYVGKTLVPIGLSAYHELAPIRSLLEWRGLLGLGVAAAFVGVSVLAWRKSPLALVGLALFALPLAPVLYIPALGDNAFAERYLYLPSVGAAILAGHAIATIGRRGAVARRLAIFAAVALTLAFAAGSLGRTRVWRDDVALWSDAVRSDPLSHHAHLYLGAALQAQGDLTRALEQYDAAISLRPTSAPAHNNRGLTLSRLGRTSEAIAEFRRSLELLPSAETHVNLGQALETAGLRDEAFAHYAEALRLRPDWSGAHLAMGIAWGERGDLDRAVQHLEKAIELDPRDPVPHHNLANAWRLKGRPDLAEAELALENDLTRASAGRRVRP